MVRSTPLRFMASRYASSLASASPARSIAMWPGVSVAPGRPQSGAPPPVVSAGSIDTRLPHTGHDFCTFKCKHRPASQYSGSGSPMPTVKLRATTILGEYEQAQTELVGKAVILSDGKAGTVESVWLDEMHGLRISIRGHDGKWPICTIKFMQPD